ncbi:MAG: alkaline phosphatase family protein, partial [Halobacteria archaeon]|nr:alkaline phosphatase family protein [Halobacteria archaeon]
NGTLVSGFLTPSLDDVSTDDDVVEYLKSMDYNIDADASLGHEDKEEFVENAHETLEKRADALFHFMEEEDWSLLWHVFMTTDRVNHFLWENYEEGDELANEFVEFHERVDEIIGEIRERLEDDTTLIVAADHGFCTLEREVDMNAWLREEGWQSIEGGEGDGGRGHDGGEAEDEVKDHDYGLEDVSDDTRAYSLIPGRFYINLEGREPRGSVPEDDYDEVRDELAEELRSLEDP